MRRPTPVVAVASVSHAARRRDRANARIIIDVGRALGVTDQGIVIALAAATQESSLRNVHYGDLDSLGLFQQRPSQGWGTPEEVLDPVRAATAFYGGPPTRTPERTLGLLDIAGWESMSVTQAAQAVQQLGASRSLREVGGAGAGLAVGAGLSRRSAAAPARGIRHHEAVAISPFRGV